MGNKSIEAGPEYDRRHYCQDGDHATGQVNPDRALSTAGCRFESESDTEGDYIGYTGSPGRLGNTRVDWMLGVSGVGSCPSPRHPSDQPYQGQAQDHGYTEQYWGVELRPASRIEMPY